MNALANHAEKITFKIQWPVVCLLVVAAISGCAVIGGLWGFYQMVFH